MAKRKEPEDTRSAVIKLLDLTWQNANAKTSFSYERLNHSMANAVSLAIGAGFAFAEDDIKLIRANYRSSYWIGESDEWMYCEAVAVGNMSAIKSYEKWKKREPFIAEQVDIQMRRHNAYQHGSGSRQKERLVVGATFKWQGAPVKVTSFSSDQSYINCCSYKRIKGQYGYSEKIDKRFKITRSELLEGRAFDRERRTLIDRIRGCANEAAHKAISTKLKIKKLCDYETVSLDKLRAAVDKHIPAQPRPPRRVPVVITEQHIDWVRSSNAYAAGCTVMRSHFAEYKPGMKSSQIPTLHRRWLIDNCPDVAAALGFIEKPQAVA